MLISHDDPRLSWHGHISLEQTAEYSRPWRIPFARRGLFFPALADRAATQAGVRLAFQSDTRRLAGAIVPCDGEQNTDLYVNGDFFGTSSFRDGSVFAFENLPDGNKLLELWLPQRGDFALRQLEVDAGAAVRPYADTRPRWVTYGSSITHCGEAESPSQTWPAIVARERHLHLTCLGYGGQCHLDPQIACMMRDLPADYISICAGINVYGGSSLNARTFVSHLIGFVQIVREKHPRTPLALLSPIYSRDRETTANAAGWSLQEYRQAVHDAARTLQQNGDENLIVVNGLDLFGPSFAHLMPDHLHPDAEGYKVLGRNFLQHAAPLLFD
jgi:hypothetical protein